MQIALFSKSILCPESVRASFKTSVTKFVDSRRLPVDGPSAVFNALSELAGDDSGVTSFNLLDSELDHYFLSLLFFGFETEYTYLIDNFRHIAHLKLNNKENYTLALFSGNLADWKTDLTRFLVSDKRISKDFSTCTVKLFKEIGIPVTLFDGSITEKLDRFLYLEKR